MARGANSFSQKGKYTHKKGSKRKSPFREKPGSVAPGKFKKKQEIVESNKTEKYDSNAHRVGFNSVPEDVLNVDISDPTCLLLSTFEASSNNESGKRTLKEVMVDRNRSLKKPKKEKSVNVDTIQTHNLVQHSSHSDSDENNCDDVATTEAVVVDEDGSDDDDDVDDELEEDSVISNGSDPFFIHFNYDLSSPLVEAVSNVNGNKKQISLYWPCLHNLKCEIPTASEKDADCNDVWNKILENNKENAKEGEEPKICESIDWNKLCVKTQIQDNIKSANRFQLNASLSESELTGLQTEIFSIVNGYQDLFYPERNLINGEEIRFVYSLHAVNHILKTRLRILHHNSRLRKKQKEQVSEEYRDQGLVRPKIIILVPFKDSCFRIVNMISDILIKEDKGNIINKKRFIEEFSGSELIMPKKNAKPEDYEELFKGNIDDKFKIGLSFTRKSLKLYSDFYSSDIIIASPLGLRMVIGAEGDKKRDFDFLASVELLILDQAELFLMQNWDHLMLIFEHLHIQPKESHGTDFSRIRSWVLNGWTKFYRQTLIFSSIVTPELNALFNRHCNNYAGKIRVLNPTEFGSICSVVKPLSHVFQKFKSNSAADACEARFSIFRDKILPQYRDPGITGVLIYTPSYFDYVRIRNYLKREDFSFVQICEYSKDGRIARARDKFFHKECRFLLYSERFHFFRRIRLKGIRHIIFYQLPTFPHFYSELCNMMTGDGERNDESNDCGTSVTVLYCKYDTHQLSAIVRTSRASKLLSSEKDIHMFTTG